MADPVFNSQSLYSLSQQSHVTEPSNELALNTWPQQNISAFRFQVKQQTLPNNYLNTSNLGNESFHNPYSDSPFEKVPAAVLYSEQPMQCTPLDLSLKPNAHDQSAKHITSESALKIDRDWSMAGEATCQPQSINTSHPASTSMVQETAENIFPNSDLGALLSVSSTKPLYAPSQQKDQVHNNSEAQATDSSSSELLTSTSGNNRNIYRKIYNNELKKLCPEIVQKARRIAIQTATEAKQKHVKQPGDNVSRTAIRDYERTYQKTLRHQLKSVPADIIAKAKSKAATAEKTHIKEPYPSAPVNFGVKQKLKAHLQSRTNPSHSE